MKANVGGIDRVVRIIAGLAILSLYFVLEGPMRAGGRWPGWSCSRPASFAGAPFTCPSVSAAAARASNSMARKPPGWSLPGLAPLVLAASVFAQAAPPGAVVTYRDIDRVAAAEGVVEAVRQSTLAAQIAGRIVALNVKAGDACKAGQVLVQIDRAARCRPRPRARARCARLGRSSPTPRRNTSAAGSLVAQKFISQAALDQARPTISPRRHRPRRRIANAGQAATSKSFTTIVRALHRCGRLDRGRSGRHGHDREAAASPCSIRASCASRRRCRRPCSCGEARRTGERVEIPTLRSHVRREGRHRAPRGGHAHAHHARAARLARSGGTACRDSTRGRSFVDRTHARLAIPAAAVLRRSEVTAVYVLDRSGAARLRQVRLGEPAGDGLVESTGGPRAGRARVARAGALRHRSEPRRRPALVMRARPRDSRQRQGIASATWASPDASRSSSSDRR